MALLRQLGRLLVTFAVLAFMAEDAAASDRIITRTGREGSASLAAYRGTLLWDSVEGLYSWRNGKRRTVARPPSTASVFRDIDLGPAPEGNGKTAVVRRCRGWGSDEECDIARVNLRSGRLK